ncbi:tRNA pseudouridine(13) synthase TruD [Marinospirillum perlucidum]|uniref:tRNA pseudouridine(13) synthase TruD n=1 Tax=Marinospirillum perlucidum TaxID=1982602 RepID=UPI000DF299DF|nr:tRNA pseudouridine(13) synthase TruD [Marinospirillum perlucidum]
MSLPPALEEATGDALPLAWPASPWSGCYRLNPEDFQVTEELGFEPEGEGEHLFLWIEKTGTNTQYLAEELARRLQLPAKAVSFSGLKDRHAVTRQWFSLHLPGQDDPDWTTLNSENWQILAASRHRKKLKRGVHRSNHFRLRIRIDQQDPNIQNWLEERWQLLSQEGVPNYFGPQRFGRQGQNLHFAWQWLMEKNARRPGRQKKSLWLSSLRSALFNRWLAEAVQRGDWNQALEGGCFNLAATRSQFFATEQDSLEDLQTRISQGDLHPCGPLAGRAPSTAGEPSHTQARQLEAAFMQEWQPLVTELGKQGLQLERRSQRLLPKMGALEWQAPWVTLNFSLPAGSFATSLLREVVTARDASQAECGKVADQ